MKIRNVFDLNKALAIGPYAWPGGYPYYFVTADGAALSFEAVRDNAAMVRDAVITKDAHSGWCVEVMDINWEDPRLTCEHTEVLIPSAYDPEE